MLFLSRDSISLLPPSLDVQTASDVTTIYAHKVSTHEYHHPTNSGSYSPLSPPHTPAHAYYLQPPHDSSYHHCLYSYCSTSIQGLILELVLEAVLRPVVHVAGVEVDLASDDDVDVCEECEVERGADGVG